MFKRVKPYMGEYMSYTKKAILCVCIAIVFSVLPYFFLYKIIEPLINGQELALTKGAMLIALTAICMVGNAVLYVKGLSYSHYSVYNTLKNIRISLQKKLEAQPLGTIRELGNGRIKKVFTDDIETIELCWHTQFRKESLLIPIIVIISMF